MAARIRMTPDTMRMRASDYRAEGENLQDIIDRMDVLLNQLQDEWEGDASVAYAERFNELRPGFVAAKELIDSIATALDKTAQSLEEVDAQLAAQFRG